MTEAPDREAKDRPRVLAPAPLIVLPVFVLGWILELLVPLNLLEAPSRWLWGGSLLVLSVAIAVSTLREFRRSSTPFDATKQATTLVTSGLFRYSRNPGYVSMVLLAAAVGIVTDGIWVLLLLVPAVVVLHYGVVLPEERHLQAVFGDDFGVYRSAVRRWL